MAYRPPNQIVKILDDFFNSSPPSIIPSNFPAMAEKLANMQADAKDREGRKPSKVKGRWTKGERYTSYDAQTNRRVEAVAPLPDKGIEPHAAMEAPQERDLDARVMARKVERALMRMSPQDRTVLDCAYDKEEADPKLTAALTPLLVGLAPFSRLEPEKHVDDARIMTAIRIELDEIWRAAHCAFENEFKNI